MLRGQVGQRGEWRGTLQVRRSTVLLLSARAPSTFPRQIMPWWRSTRVRGDSAGAVRPARRWTKQPASILSSRTVSWLFRTMASTPSTPRAARRSGTTKRASAMGRAISISSRTVCVCTPDRRRATPTQSTCKPARRSGPRESRPTRRQAISSTRWSIRDLSSSPCGASRCRTPAE